MKISDKQKEKIQKIGQKYNLKLIMLFGSLATKKAREDSDIDIALLGHSNKVSNDYLDILEEFSQIFNRKIDLSIMNNANPLLLNEVQKDSLLLYGSKENYINFSLYAFHRYNDYLPYFKKEREFLKEKYYVNK